ncbi:MAG: hypothetical protein KGO96_13970 [Elusimicrobia bacterium]|nr:hypothetical protein [Elusimicrobiota bacterium]
MSRRATTLETRLIEWGQEYGGGKYGLNATIENGVVVGASYGPSPLASMMKWHGKAPDGLGQSTGCTAADEVDEAVRALASQPQGLLPSIIVTLEYWLPGQPVEAKQMRLRKRGDNVSRVRYYQHLRVARIHIAGWLHIPFSEPDIEDVA